VLNVQHLTAQARAIVETEADYQRRNSVQNPPSIQAHLNVAGDMSGTFVGSAIGSAIQNNSPHATQEATISHGKPEEGGFAKWLKTSFGYVRKAWKSLRGGA